MQSGDANTGYNAASALVQGKSRQDYGVEAFADFVKESPWWLF
ncbi:cell division protein CpoB, partial [Salmonella enterica]